MILLQKVSSEASKHPHDPQFVLAMCIASTRIKHHVLDSPFTTYSSSAFVSTPQISVDNDGGDALAIVQMLIADKSRYNLFNRLFYQRAKGRILAVCAFAFLEDGQETISGVEVSPGFRVVVGLFGIAAAGYDGTRQASLRVTWCLYLLGTGKPKTGFEKPSGIGAAVVCSFANLAANDSPDPFSLPDDVPVISRKSVTKNAPPAASSRGPCAKLAGQSEGTV